MAEIDVIETETTSLPTHSLPHEVVREPVLIKGAGNMTM
jgi:hypothetical protein